MLAAAGSGVRDMSKARSSKLAEAFARAEEDVEEGDSCPVKTLGF